MARERRLVETQQSRLRSEQQVFVPFELARSAIRGQTRDLRAWREAPFVAIPSRADDVDKLFHRARRLLQRRILFGRQLDFDDLLDAARAQIAAALPRAPAASPSLRVPGDLCDEIVKA